MWISRRRVYWSAVLLLAGAAAVLVRPARSILDQAFVHYMVHPGIAVDELQVHYGDSVLQAKSLHWENSSGERTIGFDAADTWLVLKPAPLVDRQLHASKIVFERSNIYLISGTGDDSSPSSIRSAPQPRWQRDLASQIAQVDWNELASRFESVLAADKIAQKWASRLSAWTEESEEIFDESDAIANDLGNIDNPLRDEDELRARLELLRKLESRQQQLVSRFAGVREFLEAERLRLETSHQKEQTEVLDIDVSKLSMAVSRSSARVANDILNELALVAWEQHRDLLEGPARLALGPAQAREIASNIDFEFSSQPRIDLTDVTASGKFHSPSGTVPFLLAGKYVSMNSVAGYRWDYKFHTTDATVRVQVSQTADAQFRKISLNADAAAGSTLQGSMTTSGERIGGLFSLFPTELNLSDSNFSVQQVVSAYAVDEDVKEPKPVQFRVQGSWDAPRFSFLQTEYAWLEEEVQRRSERTLQDRVIEASSRAENDFQTLLAEIDSIVDRAGTIHQRLTGAEVSRLSDARGEMERRLSRMTESPVLR